MNGQTDPGSRDRVPSPLRPLKGGAHVPLRDDLWGYSNKPEKRVPARAGCPEVVCQCYDTPMAMRAGSRRVWGELPAPVHCEDHAPFRGVFPSLSRGLAARSYPVLV